MDGPDDGHIGTLDSLSRRRFLRLGLGAQALIWTAPAIVVMRPGVAAAVSPPPNGADDNDTDVEGDGPPRGQPADSPPVEGEPVAAEPVETVTEQVPGTPTTDGQTQVASDELAETGQSLFPLVAAGLGATTVGAGLLRGARRRSSGPAAPAVEDAPVDPDG